MKVLVVDDSDSRIALIKSHLSEIPNAKYLQVSYCDSADKARMELTDTYDLLVLDILIPKKSGAVAQAKHSIDLLEDICDPGKRYIRPKLIIGLTADIEGLSTYKEKFERHACVVLSGSPNKLDWLEQLQSQIESIQGTNQKIAQGHKDISLFTVHGIRTYGQWQSHLAKDVEGYSRYFESIEIKYEFLDIFSFLLPFRRKTVIEKAAKRLLAHIQKYPDRDIHIIAHSFGSLIVTEALKNFSSKGRLKSVIFCGSPLPHDENIDHIVEVADFTLNECGTHDFVLAVCRLFVPGLGDAGRIGFERENTDRFINRYFRGGHSLYFKEYDRGVKFYERFWFSHIVGGQKPERLDARTNYLGQDISEIIIICLAFKKPLVSLLLVCTLLGFMFY